MNSSSSPLVSVVIPTYSRPYLLERALKSVIAQTYKNIEIVVIDDNLETLMQSETERVVRSLDHLTRIKYIRNANNIGGSASRNKGISFSLGNLIAFLDDDDEWYSKKIENQVKQMLLSKEKNVGIIYCGTVITDDYTKKVRSTRFKKIKGDFRRDILFDNFVVTTSAILVQKAVLREIGGFDETLPSSQDWDLLIRLSKRCTIDYCDDYLLEYHVHSSRVSNRIDDKLRTFHMYKPVLEDYSRSFSASERRKIMGLYYFRMGHQLLKSGSKKESRSYLVSSLRKHPLNSMIVVDLVLSLLPKVITRALLWIKHAIQKGVEIN